MRPGEAGGARAGFDPVAYISLWMMILIASTSATASKVAVREIPTGLVPLVQFGTAGLVLLPLVWRSKAFRRMIRYDKARLLLTAALFLPIRSNFFFNGIKLAPTTHFALIDAAFPLIVLALATTIGQERPSLGRLIGGLASMAGVAVIFLENLNGRPPEGRDAMLGDLLLVLAVTSGGAYVVVLKPLVVRYGSLPTLAGRCPLLFFDLPAAGGDEHATWSVLGKVSSGAWMALGYLVLVVSIGGLFFQASRPRRLDASQCRGLSTTSFRSWTVLCGHLHRQEGDDAHGNARRLVPRWPSSERTGPPIYSDVTIS